MCRLRDSSETVRIAAGQLIDAISDNQAAKPAKGGPLSVAFPVLAAIPADQIQMLAKIDARTRGAAK